MLYSAPVLQDTLARLIQVYTAASSAHPWIDQRYIDHPLLTLLHLGAGAVYLALAPLQFSTGLRQYSPPLHRALGRIAAVCATASAAAICIMVILFPAIGGVLTQIVTIALNFALVAFLVLAIAALRSRNIRLHRAFMLRAYALGLSVATARWIIDGAALFFELPFETTFTLASALGVIMNLACVELLLRRA